MIVQPCNSIALALGWTMQVGGGNERMRDGRWEIRAQQRAAEQPRSINEYIVKVKAKLGSNDIPLLTYL